MLNSLLTLLNTLLHGSLITICAMWVVRFIREIKSQKNPSLQIRCLVIAYLAWLGFGFCYDLTWVFWETAINQSITAKIILLQLDSLIFPLTTLLMTDLTRRRQITTALVLSHLLPFLPIPPIGILIQQDWYFYALLCGIGVYCFISILGNTISANRYRHYICEEYADLQGRDIRWMNQFFILYSTQVVLWIVAMWWAEYSLLQLIYYIICIFIIALVASNLKRMIQVIEHSVEDTISVDIQNMATEGKEPQPTGMSRLDTSSFLTRLERECVQPQLYTHPDITRDELSRAMGLNHTYFTKLLHESTGMNFNEYINNLRLNYAEQLLADMQIPLNAIPAMAGFNSKATYYSVFTKKFGCTPKVYREQMIPS